jgi:RNA polymerase sigma-70 factor (ECF subfamily)
MLNEQSESERLAFVDALKKRAPDARAALYDECYPALFRYVFVRTSDISVAEDVAAAAFLEALKSIDSYRYLGRPILAWLYRITSNLVSNHFKSVRRKQEQPLSAINEHVLLGSSPMLRGIGGSAPPNDPAESAQLLDIRNGLLRLRVTHREVLVLHYYLGLTLPEVALMLGKKERAVYSLHARAIEALRKVV